jgi:hypothetical protein
VYVRPDFDQILMSAMSALGLSDYPELRDVRRS